MQNRAVCIKENVQEPYQNNPNLPSQNCVNFLSGQPQMIGLTPESNHYLKIALATSLRMINEKKKEFEKIPPKIDGDNAGKNITCLS